MPFDRYIAGIAEGLVLLDVTHTDRSRVAATLGVYDTTLLPIGLDAGVMADATGAEPIGRFTLGVHGVGVRLSGGVDLGPEPHLIGTVELVVEMFELGGRL